MYNRLSGKDVFQPVIHVARKKIQVFPLVYLFVLRQGISHLKFINSDKIDEAFLRFMTFAYRLQWITNDVLQKPNLESDVILQRMRFTCKCGRRVKKNIQTHVF